MKRFAYVLAAFALAFSGGIALAGCGGNNPEKFITVVNAGDSSKYVKVGMARADMDAIFGSNLERDLGITRKWENKTNFNNCVSFNIVGTLYQTAYGVSLNSAKADILPAYAKDPAVKVLQNDDGKVVLGRNIGGVNFTVTFRLYPDGSRIKYITLTNTDLYTENDADYQ